ncbi:tumor necrosis factor ligand superfamily member 18 [Triplophysa rosa]|uniref:Tumor necrosis factor ligand superfamily n=1 Tax=Triplophysa rosa TaxID=992332 RepID=A0A9W7TWJ0_TRIRA|nr:tumor necrosis factor ligand superfamily member 18 [Triplophysa rosa]KAI7803544.1 tumor necrosis factor ligand superfamily [Triplophysa rosa]
MSLSPECCDEKTGNRDGGALARQKRLICGLFIWSTLLTLGLATIVVFQFFNGASLDSGKHKILSMSASSTPSPVTAHGSTTQSSDLTPKLMIFDPAWGHSEMVELKWQTNSRHDFITVKERLTFNKDGQYFLYLQVTLESKQSCNVTVEVKGQSSPRVILSSQISQTKPSTGLMGKGFPVTKGDHLTVNCNPATKIKKTPTETYLGVIKIE